MTSRITEKSFFQYIKCPSWIYFDAKNGAPKPHHPLFAKLIDDSLIEEEQLRVLNAHLAKRNAATSQFISHPVPVRDSAQSTSVHPLIRGISPHPLSVDDVAQVDYEDEEDAFRQTLEFMHAGRQTIYRGVLMDRHWVGHPDVLERVEGKSKFGDYYYVAADIKRARVVRDDYKFQGCFYAELLERIQGAKPYQGYVINSEAEVLPYLIADFESEFQLTLDEIERIVAGQRPVHFSTSGCKQSPWFSECHGFSLSCDDLTLLNRVWRKEVELLMRAGVMTVSDLAAKTDADLRELPAELASDRLNWMREQARALKDGKHRIVNAPKFPASDVELYVDIESDPLRDFDYLFGALEVGYGENSFHLFAAQAKNKTEEMWRSFCDYIAKHPRVPIYHYGSFEPEVFRRFIERFGAPDIVQETLAKHTVDLLEIVRVSVIFPLSFYSLKDIGAYIGYHWKAEDASGANSILWFEDWLEKKDVKIFQKIAQYNEDDVRATWALKKWLEGSR